MHEWALADAVITTVLKVVKEKKIQGLCTVRVKVGKLQQMDMEVFQYALGELLKSSALGKDKVKIVADQEEALLRCKNCGHQWSFEENRGELKAADAESIHFLPEVAHAYVGCPHCQSPDFEIEKGRGVWIEAIETE